VKIVNEASILEARELRMRSGEFPHRIVLRYIPDSDTPYSTNYENLKVENGELHHYSFYLGRCFSSLEEAKHDFDFRQ